MGDLVKQWTRVPLAELRQVSTKAGGKCVTLVEIPAWERKRAVHGSGAKTERDEGRSSPSAGSVSIPMHAKMYSPELLRLDTKHLRPALALLIATAISAAHRMLRREVYGDRMESPTEIFVQTLTTPKKADKVL